MTGNEAVNYIHSKSWLGTKPGLERITELCAGLGNPQDSLRVIHVAGTNGKGSFCAMLASILEKCGLKVGLFTSPYVWHFNERIRIGECEITDDELGDVTEKVKTVADKMKNIPTEFELLTAVGYLYFKEQACDVVIMEAGLGGRLDSTNGIKSSGLSVITGIDLDHTSILGNTVEKIAAEKAGIIKDSCPVLVGECSDGAMEVIKNTASAKNCELSAVDYSRISDESVSLKGTAFTFGGENYELSLIGKYQIKNAAAVLTAVEILKGAGFEISEANVKEGLSAARWKARFELLGENPTVIYDGAHNPQGISVCAENVKAIFGDVKPVGLMGVMADKDYKQMVPYLRDMFTQIYTVTVPNDRGLYSFELAGELERNRVSVVSYRDLRTGIRKAFEHGVKENLPVIAFGSLYLYSDVADEYNNFKK